MPNKFLKYYLPALIWLGIIFYFSSIPSLRYSKSAIEEIILRKGAHFVEFSILAFLIWRIFYFGYKLEIKKSYFWTLLLTILFGISDEWHQTFVSGRTGKIIDALFDGVSIFLFLEIILIWTRKKVSFKNIIILILSVLMLIGLEIVMIQKDKSEERKQFGIILKNEINVIRADFENRIIEEDDNENSEEKDSPNNFIDEYQKIPAEIFIEVPFTSQAPFAVWDEFHEEACEEASIIMLKYFFSGEELTREVAEEEIQALISFQNENKGDYRDTTAQETADLFIDFYGEIGEGKKLKVVYDFKKDYLKKYLAQGYPIIIPAAGRELGNPNFTAPGPLYHNLVLIGYDGDTIITNDPGTKRGERYEYDVDVIYNAIHDFPGKPENINQGRKAMIVVDVD